MRLDLADTLKIGDCIYNCFMDQLVITSINKDLVARSIFFGTIDTRLRKASYDSNDVYLKDFEGESDEEKSWVEWAKDNRDFFDEFDHLETMREVYKIGFGNGFAHKRKITYEENMQK